ncbi:sulfonate ABC transporter substrate-binding protein [Mycobacterium sp. ACS1612]|uniref:purine-cytosine permease family protein n=1 Tax=Mycobacterium sp. ACS1612 TaxID=1834117 RepID=UPI0007FC496A|nr:cytosine permease [Mycobacterium sp. ACS1612]OBF31616.1 sulfonate ABC transporter substrate-binding protein [Mycobacterium sp. ACS1612]
MAVEVERRTIDVVPDNERHGKPRDQFTLWFGANMQITAIVDGALAVVFGADPLWAIIGLLIGNVCGGVVMALHSAQGPKMGIPQMISSRAQFGVWGACLPLVLVVLMYLGFAATGTVLSGQAINEILGIDAPSVGIVIFGLLTLIVAVIGYRMIHRLGRLATVVCAVGFTYIGIRMLMEYDVPALLGAKPFDVATFLLAVSLGAGWQLTFGPYVADYSRYLPRSTPESSTFWSTFLGSVIGSQWSMTLGAIVAAGAGDEFLASQVTFIGDLAGGVVVATAIYVVIVTGKLAVNCLNAYGGLMTILTTATAFTRTARVPQWIRTACVAAFIVISVITALIATKDFLDNFRNFVLLILMAFTPWSAVNLVDYYLISKERVDIPALYDPNGRYGRMNFTALVSYVIGILIQLPFLSQSLYTGPLVDDLGGADISWIVGLLGTAALYYFWARRTARPPSQMIYPDGVSAVSGERG